MNYWQVSGRIDVCFRRVLSNQTTSPHYSCHMTSRRTLQSNQALICPLYEAHDSTHTLKTYIHTVEPPYNMTILLQDTHKTTHTSPIRARHRVCLCVRIVIDIVYLSLPRYTCSAMRRLHSTYTLEKNHRTQYINLKGTFFTPLWQRKLWHIHFRNWLTIWLTMTTNTSVTGIDHTMLPPGVVGVCVCGIGIWTHDTSSSNTLASLLYEAYIDIAVSENIQ